MRRWASEFAKDAFTEELQKAKERLTKALGLSPLSVATQCEAFVTNNIASGADQDRS